MGVVTAEILYVERKQEKWWKIAEEEKLKISKKDLPQEDMELVVLKV